MIPNKATFFLPAFVTVIVGVLPVAVSSYLTNTFFLNSNHPFPFLKNLSVCVGDTFFLSLFNCYFIGAIVHLNKKDLSDSFAISILVLLLMSMIIQIVIHYIWINDKYTGFMDTTLQQLSFAGYWHLCYSIVQMTIIFIYTYLLFTTINQSVYSILKSGTILLVLYSLTGIVNIWINYNILYVDKPALTILKSEIGSISVFVYSLIIHFAWFNK